MTPDMELKKLARSAILKAKGDTEKARDILNQMIIERDSASLERELCAAYRNTAIGAVLATHYQELRSEGRLPALREPIQIQTTNYDQIVEKHKPSDFLWAPGGMTAEGIKRRYLDTFLVNGKPIGDCRVEEVDRSADARDRDTRFMRTLVQGLPPAAIVREHRTEEDAAKLWEAAHWTEG